MPFILQPHTLIFLPTCIQACCDSLKVCVCACVCVKLQLLKLWNETVSTSLVHPCGVEASLLTWINSSGMWLRASRRFRLRSWPAGYYFIVWPPALRLNNGVMDMQMTTVQLFTEGGVESVLFWFQTDPFTQLWKCKLRQAAGLKWSRGMEWPLQLCAQKP